MPSRAPTIPPTSPFSASYEAESAANTLAGGARVLSCGLCSGGEKVGSIGTSGGLLGSLLGTSGSLRFNGVTVPSSGTYQLTIVYCDGIGRSADVSVDGASPTLVHFTSTGSFSVPGSLGMTLNLTAGAHTITFSNPQARAPDVDRITLSP